MYGCLFGASRRGKPLNNNSLAIQFHSISFFAFLGLFRAFLGSFNFIQFPSLPFWAFLDHFDLHSISFNFIRCLFGPFWPPFNFIQFHSLARRSLQNQFVQVGACR